MMDEPGLAVVDKIEKTHTKCSNESAANITIQHTTVVESKNTGVNNAVDKVPAFPKEPKEEDSDKEDDNTNN